VLFLFIVLALQLKEVYVTPLHNISLVPQMLYFCLLVKVVLVIYCYNIRLVTVINSFSLDYFCNNIAINATPNVLLQVGGDVVVFLHLFTDKSALFILVGFILLFSMVGSIALCVREVRPQYKV
jgi:NADH:ubiquinone oxidoreductase subunit 6 (subunit J)